MHSHAGEVQVSSRWGLGGTCAPLAVSLCTVFTSQRTRPVKQRVGDALRSCNERAESEVRTSRCFETCEARRVLNSCVAIVQVISILRVGDFEFLSKPVTPFAAIRTTTPSAFLDEFTSLSVPPAASAPS